MDHLHVALTFVGAGAGAYLAYSLADGLWTYLRPSQLHRYHHNKSGSTWALVTGASDGIGRGFVNNLLAENFNVLLHGRNSEKLSLIQSELSAQYPHLSIRTVTSDASVKNLDIDALVEAVTNLSGPLTILINNIGGTPPGTDFTTVEESPASYVDALMNMNSRFPTQVTRAMLPFLKTNAPSLVMNIGSVAGQLGMPYVTVYGACKAFNNQFSRALKAEMRAEGLADSVEVLGILVSKVRSAGTAGFRTDAFTATSDQLARAALDRVGCGKALVWAWWRHWLQNLALSVVPEALLERILVRALMEQREDERKRKAKAK